MDERSSLSSIEEEERDGGNGLAEGLYDDFWRNRRVYYT